MQCDPSLLETRACTTDKCDVDCQVDSWSEWALCTAGQYCDGMLPMATGKESRSRTVSRQPYNAGAACPALVEEQVCTTSTCAVDCVMGSWSAWVCDAAQRCDGAQPTSDGVETRVRGVQRPALNGGQACGNDKEQEACMYDLCPVACTVSPWGDWSACSCSQLPDAGTRTRSRLVAQPPLNRGDACPQLSEVELCKGTQACLVASQNSLVGAEMWFLSANAVEAVVGLPGDTTRSQVASLVAAAPGAESASSTCTFEVVVDMAADTMTLTGSCPGQGDTPLVFTGITSAQNRTQSCDLRTADRVVVTAHYGGTQQVVSSFDPASLQVQGSAAQGWESKDYAGAQTWAYDNGETALLGDSQQVITVRGTFRAVAGTRLSVFLGCGTSGNCQAEDPTSLQALCPVPCVLGDWQWSQCSATCDRTSPRATGTQVGRRPVLVHALYGGTPCPSDEELRATRGCEVTDCPVDCDMTAWSEWSCSASCDGINPTAAGLQVRTRAVTRPALQGGVPCGQLAEEAPCRIDACPVACVTGEWSPWVCDALSRCNGSTVVADGSQARRRDVVVQAQNGGEPCGDLAETGSCTTVACPVPCQVSGWSEWQCDAASMCNGQTRNAAGTQVRQRQVVVEPQNTKAGCPVLVEQLPCSVDTCNVDCLVGPWSDPMATACKAECDGVNGAVAGQRTRTRDVQREPQNEGAACGDLALVEQCVKTCPVSCAVSAWSEWTQCTASCGAGTQQRVRSVSVPDQNGGTPCPALVEYIPCQGFECPRDCLQGEWVEGACSAVCDGINVSVNGTRIDQREVAIAPQYGGAECGPAAQTVACTVDGCPVNCQVAEWAPWSPCDGAKACDGQVSEAHGLVTRTRLVAAAPLNGGKACPELVENAPCISDCDVDCAVSDWVAGVCDAVCVESSPTAEGKQVFTRDVVRNQAHDGTPCPALMDARTCYREDCPVACQPGAWGEWSTCDKDCGTGGTMTRTRPVAAPAQNGGAECVTVDRAACEGTLCPVDCVLTPFTFDSCSAVCDGRNPVAVGTQQGSRTVMVEPLNGGMACNTTLQITESCQITDCPVHCEVDQWTEWACAASSNCDGQLPTASGLALRSRSVLVAPNSLGMACPGLQETQTCTAQCDVDCVVSDWVVGDCQASCDGAAAQSSGTAVLTRQVTRASANNGAVCPDLQSTTGCVKVDCPVNCVMGEWSEWQGCSASCGAGMQQRTRSPTTFPVNNGLACPETIGYQECYGTACPRDCELSEYAEGACLATCNGTSVVAEGHRIDTRRVVVEPAYGGGQCEELQRVEACTIQGCAVACEVGPWSAWSCDASSNCNGTTGTVTGINMRTREVTREAANGGTGCPLLQETDTCTAPCDVDCLLSAWAEWSPCDAMEKCTGTQPEATGASQRTRYVTRQPENGGMQCDPSLLETRACTTDQCDVDCQVGLWSDWQSTDGCNGASPVGQRSSSRSRLVSIDPLNGGAVCPPLEDIQVTQIPCPVGCVVSEWGDWGFCSTLCGSGAESSARIVLQQPANDGAACPDLERQRSCDSFDGCVRDCVTSAWEVSSPCTASCQPGVEQAVGVATKTRTVLVTPANGGTKCPSLDTVEPCRMSCPVDCVLSDWTEWSDCSTACGIGERARNRTTVQAAMNNGVACPSDMDEVATCSSYAECPTDCQLAPTMTLVEPCNATCSPDGLSDQSYGVETWERQVLSPAAYGGQPCPPPSSLVETRACSVACQQDCSALGDWSDWYGCTDKCTSGLATRTRKSAGASTCPDVMDYQACDTSQCQVAPPVPCAMSDWTTQRACDATCVAGASTANGTAVETRTVLVEPHNGGSACPANLEQTVACSITCPIDCEVSDWAMWSSCSVDCGTGYRVRDRAVVAQEANGGMSCPSLLDVQDCTGQACPQDCLYSPWSEPTTCSAVCDGTSGSAVGQTTQTRTIVVPEQYGGKACSGDMTLVSSCTVACEIPCVVSSWGDWSTCSLPCGEGGTRVRTRVVTRNPENTDALCPSLADTEPCTGQECPVDCVVTAFKYDPCNADCNSTSASVATGQQHGYRTLLQAPAYGGLECPPDMTTTVPCTVLCPHSCITSSWSDWSCTGDCNQASGPMVQGTAIRTRSIISPAYNGGDACGSLYELGKCEFDCPFVVSTCNGTCVYTDWSAWTTCSATCGEGGSTRTRVVSAETAACDYSQKCTEVIEVSACSTSSCPLDCVMGAWTDWSCDASSNCDGVVDVAVGTQTRTRPIVAEPLYGGASCPAATQQAACSTVCPYEPVPCAVGAWADWSVCDVSCGTGVQKRIRPVVQQPQHNGTACGDLEEQQACVGSSCPVDCQVSEWSDWVDCSASCTGAAPSASGFENRTRNILAAPAFDGTACPLLADSRLCSINTCPVDCVVNTWSDWSMCACTDGTETANRTRYRVIATLPQNNGTGCPTELQQDEACPNVTCSTSQSTTGSGSSNTGTVAGAAAGAAAAVLAVAGGYYAYKRMSRPATPPINDPWMGQDDELFVRAVNPLYEAAGGENNNPLFEEGYAAHV